MDIIKKILESLSEDECICIRSLGDFSKAEFECCYEGNGIVFGLLHFRGFWNCESCCGLLLKFESYIFRRNRVRVVLIALPEHLGTSVTNICEGIVQHAIALSSRQDIVV